MAVKKKSSKKVASKAKKTTRKSSTKKSLRSRVSARSAQKIDELLVKMNPNLQAKVNQLMSALEKTKESRLGDLTFLAGKILMRAQEVSRGLKEIRQKGQKKK